MSEIFDGYVTDPGFDPAEDHIGPFYYREWGEGRYDCRFVAEKKNCNVYGAVHGGVLMSFADFALCLIATDHYKEEDCVTVSFSADFVSSANLGDIIDCVPKVTRKTGSLVFVTGELTVEKMPVITFSAVAKRLHRK
jgi:acyl-coenzyme A thioesterase 13